MIQSESNPSEITELIDQLGQADSPHRRALIDELMPLLYGELKILAKSNRYRWQDPDGFGTTSLVHEAYAKLANHSNGRFQNRRQFYALASRAMRTIIIDKARLRGRLKRGGGTVSVDMPQDLLLSEERSRELVDLDDALRELEALEPDLARIVECRCFGGLTVEDTAQALDISPATVKRRFALARAWLYRHLAPTLAPTSAA